MDDLPELGVGLIYSPGLEPLLQAYPELVDVLEIEPQTTWIETNSEAEPYLVRDDVHSHIAELPGETVQALDAPWASEHLSFNLTPDFFTGFSCLLARQRRALSSTSMPSARYATRWAYRLRSKPA